MPTDQPARNAYVGAKLRAVAPDGTQDDLVVLEVGASRGPIINPVTHSGRILAGEAGVLSSTYIESRDNWMIAAGEAPGAGGEARVLSSTYIEIFPRTRWGAEIPPPASAQAGTSLPRSLPHAFGV